MNYWEGRTGDGEREGEKKITERDPPSRPTKLILTFGSSEKKDQSPSRVVVRMDPLLKHEMRNQSWERGGFLHKGNNSKENKKENHF